MSVCLKAKAAPRVPLFFSYHILTSSVIYYLTDARQLGIYLLNIRRYIYIYKGNGLDNSLVGGGTQDRVRVFPMIFLCTDEDLQ